MTPTKSSPTRFPSTEHGRSPNGPSSPEGALRSSTPPAASSPRRPSERTNANPHKPRGHHGHHHHRRPGEPEPRVHPGRHRSSGQGQRSRRLVVSSSSRGTRCLRRSRRYGLRPSPVQAYARDGAGAVSVPVGECRDGRQASHAPRQHRLRPVGLLRRQQGSRGRPKSPPSLIRRAGWTNRERVASGRTRSTSAHRVPRR